MLMIHSQAVAQTPLMYEQEWAGLLARIAAGDQPALAEFYDASSAKVFGLVMKILADRTVAEEVTMDVYTQVWRRASSYDAERGTPGSWLMTLAKTRAIDRFRSSYLERGRQVPLDHAAEVPGDGDARAIQCGARTAAAGAGSHGESLRRAASGDCLGVLLGFESE
jgi:RNA polymerase sigma-70 factor (ECF subfamily)